MNDTDVMQLDSFQTQYLICTCDEEKAGNGIINEALCKKETNIICDVIPTKSYQKNTCHAKRMRRSLQTRVSYIPNNFVQHQNRKKVCLETIRNRNTV